MKKFSSLASLLSVCFFISCTQTKENGISPAAQKNLDALNGISKSFDAKDFSKLGDYVAIDILDHAGEHGDIKGLDSLKAAFEQYVSTVENTKSEVIKELADDEYGMAWMKYSGTLKTASMGMKAGDHFEMKSLEVGKFKDGKMIEHWTMMEPGDVVKMLRPQAMPSVKIDTVENHK